MRQISLVLCFMFTLLGTSQDSARRTTAVAITGTLFDKGPVTDAEIDLQLLQDESCAKLFVSQRSDKRAQQKLTGCSRDLASTHPDPGGRYSSLTLHLAGTQYTLFGVWRKSQLIQRHSNGESGE
jgi:hypothetical protein